MMLAGRCRACGSRAAMMSPVSRSATNHDSAEMSSGTGGVPAATITPQPDSASPPTGFAGTGSGCGGSPASGTSEESTAGGVVTRYGQVLGSGAPAGSAHAIAGVPTTHSAAASAAAHRVNSFSLAIESQSRGLEPRNSGAALWLEW